MQHCPEVSHALQYVFRFLLGVVLDLENLLVWDWEGPESDIRCIREIDQFGQVLACTGGAYFQRMLIRYLDMVPELGRFYKEHLPAQGKSWAKVVAQDNPAWYLAYSPIMYGRECGDARPSDSYQTFLMHAWVTDTSADELARYADVSWAIRGDFYYMHKLAETIKAYRRIQWK